MMTWTSNQLLARADLTDRMVEAASVHDADLADVLRMQAWALRRAAVPMTIPDEVRAALADRIERSQPIIMVGGAECPDVILGPKDWRLIVATLRTPAPLPHSGEPVAWRWQDLEDYLEFLEQEIIGADLDLKLPANLTSPGIWADRIRALTSPPALPLDSDGPEDGAEIVFLDGDGNQHRIVYDISEDRHPLGSGWFLHDDGSPAIALDGGVKDAPSYDEWKSRALGSRVALHRLHLAVRALGKIGSNNVTLFEDSPLKSQEAYEAWTELNAAQGDAAKALGFKLLFDGEWLRAKIPSDPDIECEAGSALAAPKPDRAVARAMTDEMLNAHLKATNEWVEPYEAATECGVPIECGITQEDADELNAQSREHLRIGYVAALTPAALNEGE